MHQADGEETQAQEFLGWQLPYAAVLRGHGAGGSGPVGVAW